MHHGLMKFSGWHCSTFQSTQACSDAKVATIAKPAQWATRPPQHFLRVVQHTHVKEDYILCSLLLLGWRHQARPRHMAVSLCSQSSSNSWRSSSLLASLHARAIQLYNYPIQNPTQIPPCQHPAARNSPGRFAFGRSASPWAPWPPRRRRRSGRRSPAARPRTTSPPRPRPAGPEDVGEVKKDPVWEYPCCLSLRMSNRLLQPPVVSGLQKVPLTRCPQVLRVLSVP